MSASDATVRDYIARIESLLAADEQAKAESEARRVRAYADGIGHVLTPDELELLARVTMQNSTVQRMRAQPEDVQGKLREWATRPTHDDQHADPVSGVPGFRVRSVDIGAMLQTEPEPPDWIVEGMFEPGRLTLLHSSGGLGKSLFMLWVAASVATGSDVLGLRVPRPRRVLLVDAENDPARDLHPRLRSLGVPAEAADNLHVLEAVDVDLSQPEAVEQLRQCAESVGAELVIVDTVAEAFTLDENVRGEVTNALRRMRKVLAGDLGAAVVLIGHDRKDGDTFTGSTGFQNAVDVRLHLRRRDEPSAKAGVTSLQLTVGKARGRMFDGDLQIDFRTTSTTASFTRACYVDMRAPSLEERIIQAVERDGPMSGTAIERAVTGRAADIRRARDQLVAAGQLVHDANRYRRGTGPDGAGTTPGTGQNANPVPTPSQPRPPLSRVESETPST